MTESEMSGNDSKYFAGEILRKKREDVCVRKLG